jgi:gliding motility-associated-like protein
MKRILLFASFLTISQFVLSQCGTPGWVCMQTGSVTVSDGFTVSDDGGGSPYSDANYTLVLCPDTPGDVVQLTFSAFALQTSPNANNSDYLSVFDGNSTSAPSLGDYTGSSIQGLQITGTVFNTTGCLTLVFSDNSLANVSSPGFEAQIQCTTPCANPTTAAHIVSPAPEDPAIQTVSVCMDSPITFGDNGSFAEAGFALAHYIWNFDDGTVEDDVNGGTITHSFSEPGEYIVTLTVEDNNLGDDATGCQSLNVVPLQVLVSTYPTFSGMTDFATCLGETVIGQVEVGNGTALPDDDQIGGGASGTTWTALPPQVVSGTTYLADGAGFAYSTSLVFDFFEPGATLDDCSLLQSILVNMEHSYMGDLGIFITCPDGTMVNLIEWGTNGGGGTFLGEAVDDDGTTPGVGYDYWWTPEATNGTWGENSVGINGSLPSGTYEASGDLCDLVGCPLNGEWTFSVTDNLAIDNGYIFQWGITFDPSLYPDVTTFTPTIGAGPDSSYWMVSGPNAGNGTQWITDVSADGDAISITPEEAGVYNYTYVVLNNFGCQFDTTITVTIEEAPHVSAGLDQLYSCGAVQLDGSLIGEQPVPCANCGTYTHCYDQNFYQQTYCPDTPGSGLITLSFLSGSTDGINDYIYVYDGPDTWPSPYIGGYTGDLSGLSWTSTSASGCLTFYISEWDGGNDCADGSTVEWNYVVSCGSAVAAGYDWLWTPDTGLDFNNIQDPTVTSITQNTTYTLTGYPAGHPACASTDDVLVSVDPLGDPGLNANITICSTDAPFAMINELGGSPVSTGTWYTSAGVAIPTGIYDPAVDLPGDFEYRVEFGNCEAHAILNISMALPTVIFAPDDTLICEQGSVNLDMLSLNNGQAPFSYSWTYAGEAVSNSRNDVYSPLTSGIACLNVTDACGYVATDCFNVEVKPAVTVTFTADTTAQCWPHTFEFVNTSDANLYTSSEWTFSDGTLITNTFTQDHDFEKAGEYQVVLKLTNELGCSYSSSQAITAYAAPVAGYIPNPQPTNIENTEITFTDATEGSVATWVWTFGDVLGYSAQQNPVFEFPKDKGGVYPIKLEVTDIHNCTDIVKGEIVINNILAVYIPNTFTPNGDGINDVFFVEGADIDPMRYKFMVFNRYGDKVFETLDIETPWVGDVHGSDYYAPNGVYNYRAIIVSKTTGERKEVEGNITIMR